MEQSGSFTCASPSEQLPQSNPFPLSMMALFRLYALECCTDISSSPAPSPSYCGRSRIGISAWLHEHLRHIMPPFRFIHLFKFSPSPFLPSQEHSFCSTSSLQRKAALPLFSDNPGAQIFESPHRLHYISYVYHYSCFPPTAYVSYMLRLQVSPVCALMFFPYTGCAFPRN